MQRCQRISDIQLLIISIEVELAYKDSQKIIFKRGFYNEDTKVQTLVINGRC